MESALATVVLDRLKARDWARRLMRLHEPPRPHPGYTLGELDSRGFGIPHGWSDVVSHTYGGNTAVASATDHRSRCVAWTLWLLTHEARPRLHPGYDVVAALEHSVPPADAFVSSSL